MRSELQKNAPASKRRPRLNISEAVELLIIICLAYSFISLSKSENLFQLLINFFVVTSVLNFWITTRMSFVVYSYRVFLLDIFSIGLLYSMVGFANVTDGTLYPMPLFWLVVGALEGTYALWDYIISKLPAERTAEKTYILWSILSMCAAVSCFVAFALALSNSYNPEISILTIKTRLATVIGVGAIIYISAMNVIWNIFLGDADREARDDFSA